MSAPHQEYFTMSQQDPTVMPEELMPQHQPPQHPVPTSYYPESHNELTGDLPINLDSLRDGPPGTKPFYPYSTLIRYAIKGSPNQKLLLEDIYYAIESRFPYFRTAPAGWKNSIRHNLSLNPCFEKVPRPLTDRGKGCYWIVNDNVDPRTGVHRIRKKKPKSGSKRGQQEGDADAQAQGAEDIDYHPEASTTAPGEQVAGAPVYQDPNFGPPQVMPADGSDPSRPPPPAYPPPYGTFDPAFFHPGMRYQLPPVFRPDEAMPLDAHGNPDWAQLWRKELASLLQLTDQQDKAGADQEWYRVMWFRVRGSMMAPIMPPADLGQAGQGMPGAPGGVQGAAQ